MKESRLIKRSDVLSEDYIPNTLKGRENEINRLNACIQSLRQKRRPLNAFCYGKSGAGKTVTVKYLLNKTKAETSILCFYVNCFEAKTIHAIIDKILRDSGYVIAIANTSLKIAKLKEVLTGRPAVIVLDEIDKITPIERNELLYCLTGIKTVSIICISKYSYTGRSLDPRTLSRLNCSYILFEPYTPAEILTILRTKAKQAINPAIYKTGDLYKIALLSEGNLRTALQLLEKTVYLAEEKGVKIINTALIKRAWQEMKSVDRQYLIANHTRHHKLIFEIVRESNGIRTGPLWAAYARECKKDGIPFVSLTSFRRYLRELIMDNLIIVAHGSGGKGHASIFKAVDYTADPPES